ncbi:MAG: nitrate/nitrite transporter NrtS [Halopseudomonas sp.]
MALLVGTLLMLINYGESIIAGTMSAKDWLKVLLTYLVPYAVSTYSSVAASLSAHNSSD